MGPYSYKYNKQGQACSKMEKQKGRDRKEEGLTGVF